MLRSKILFIIFISIFSVHIFACNKIQWKVNDFSTIVKSSEKRNLKPFVLEFCDRNKTIPTTVDEAINFLIAALPSQYLIRLKEEYPKKNIYEIPLVADEDLNFVDLYRTLELKWEFSSDYNNPSKMSKLQSEAFRKNLYFTNNFLFESLLYGVWQKLKGEKVSLEKKSINGILLKFDLEQKKMSFTKKCKSPKSENDYPFSYMSETGYVRRSYWNYCINDNSFYMYLFEIGWFVMPKLQVCHIKTFEELDKEILKIADLKCTKRNQ